MNQDHRRIHHLNADESALVLQFRLLSPNARAALLALVSAQADDSSAAMPSDRVVSIKQHAHR